MDQRNTYRLSVGKSEGKRPLGRPKCRWVSTIKIDLGERRWVVLTGLFWLRRGHVESFSECGNEPSGSIKCGEILEWLHNWWLLE
jgi:hypothetical protein